MPVSHDSAIALTAAADDDSISRIFTAFTVTSFAEPNVSAVSDLDIGGVIFRAAAQNIKVRRVTRNVWLLFVRHDRVSASKSDLEIFNGNFILADFTVSITIDNHTPRVNDVVVSETPVHVIPCD